MVIGERLEAAARYLAGARALIEAGDYGGAISRCYYAAYQAMWAALGDPTPKRRWEHLGVIQAFVRGRWDDPSQAMTGPGRYERFRFPIRRLYGLRLGVDYRVDSMTQDTAEWAVGIVHDLIETIRAQARGRE